MIIKPQLPQSTDVATLRSAVQTAIDKLVMQLNRTSEVPISGAGRKIVDVAAPTNPTDAVNLQTLEKYTSAATNTRGLERAIRIINKTLLGAVNLADTHANRLTNYPATSYSVGALFYETDRDLLYIVLDVLGTLTWVYAAGEMSGLYAALPVDLVAADAGVIFNATDVAHSWVWQGANWSFHPSDPGSGWVVAGHNLQGGLWALCDGGAATLYKSDATTTSVTTPNLSGEHFLQGGGGGAAAATAPTWNAAAVTDVAGTHTHTSYGQTLGATGGPSGVIAVGGGAATSVADNTHTHDTPDTVDADTSADGGHSHALTNANALINPPSETNGGLPARYGFNWYIRC